MAVSPDTFLQTITHQVNNMQSIYLDLHISADEWLKIYRGTTNIVNARSRDGRRIQFPANILQKYVTRTGVSGSFVIYFDDNGKFQQLVKLD